MHLVLGQPVIDVNNIPGRSLGLDTKDSILSPNLIVKADTLEIYQTKQDYPQKNIIDDEVFLDVQQLDTVGCRGSQCLGKREAEAKSSGKSHLKPHEDSRLLSKRKGKRKEKNERHIGKPLENLKTTVQVREKVGEKCRLSREDRVLTLDKKAKRNGEEWHRHQQKRAFEYERPKQQPEQPSQQKESVNGQRPYFPDHYIFRKLTMVNPAMPTEAPWCKGIPCGNLPW